MRHGQTNYNLLHLCNDDPGDDVHLTEDGRKQAEEAAEQLRSVPIEHIYVSPLPRTRATAEIVNRQRQAPVTTHPALHDIRSGFNNRPVAEYFAAIAHDPLHARVNGGESLMDHKTRVLEFLHWLREQAHGTVLVVAHEETMRVFAAYFHRVPDAHLREMNFENAEILEFDL